MTTAPLSWRLIPPTRCITTRTINVYMTTCPMTSICPLGDHVTY